jgi:Ca2+-binding RTX toxin-like protein
MLATVVALYNALGGASTRVPPFYGRRMEEVRREVLRLSPVLPLGKRGDGMRRVVFMLAAMVLAMLLASGVALAANKIGTNGPDVLLGTNKADNLIGRGGNDVLPGNRGSDNIVGGAGNDLLIDGDLRESATDTLVGGDGNDVIDAFNRPAARDVIVCGDGFDRVSADRKDVVAPDCERVFSSFRAFLESIPASFFRGLPPNPITG